MPYERQCWSDSRPRFRANNIWKVYHKFLFWKEQNWYKNYTCQFVGLISMKHLHMFPHFYAASFWIKTCFMRPAMFFTLSIRHILTKLLAVPESLIKIKVRSPRTLFIIPLTSAVICKQRLLHGNEIVQHLQNCKCFNEYLSWKSGSSTLLFCFTVIECRIK